MPMKKSQENNSAGVFFLPKYQVGGLQPYLKRDFNAELFSMNVEKFSM